MDKEILDTAQRIQEIFKKRGLTLSAAESCTGGLICHYLTALPGSGNFFDSGVVTYSVESKIAILGVSSDIISRYGIISPETAEEMAEKVRLITKTDCSISTTGNLGPDVLEDKERGLVYVGVCREGEVLVNELRLTGSREENKQNAALSALRLLIEFVEK